MRPDRTLYLVRRRNWLGIPVMVMRFKTALDLDRVPGLRRRIKQAFGPIVRVSV